MAWLRAFFLLLCLGFLPAAWGEVPVPPLQSRVTDLTGTFDSGRRQALESRLAAFEQQKGAQIGILLVPTARPESIEQYGIRVAEAWKLGRRGADDGVIVILAKEDREVRIEVGYGLEGALPDVVAKRIIEEVMIPRFRNGDLAGGIEAGAERLMAVIAGEALPPPPKVAGQQGQQDASSLIDLLFPVFVVALIAGNVLRAIFGRFLGAGATAGGAALVAGFMGASLLGIAGVGALVFVLVLLGINPGVFAGGGRGGGGFSGGGGGFGGGGASGRW